MTYCDTLAEPLIRRVEVEKKTLDQIAKELCGNTVKRPRQKAIRIIKELLGEEYLIKHAESLGYNTVKAVRLKSATTTEVVKRKVVTEKELKEPENVTSDADSEGETQDDKVQEIAVERNVSNELDNTAPDKNEFNVLVGEIQRLIVQYNLENFKKALAFAIGKV